MTLRMLIALALLSLPLVPAAAADEAACSPVVAPWAWECVGVGDGCGAWADGIVATCTPSCMSPECADPTPCDPASECTPDLPACVQGETVVGENECHADVGTAPCPMDSSKSVLYVRVLIYGPSVGCF